MTRPGSRRWRRGLALYALLLMASALTWRSRGVPPLEPGWQREPLAQDTEAPFPQLAFRDLGQGDATLLLLHGSPGRGAHLASLAEALAPHVRVLLVDLPGFGASLPAPRDMGAEGTGELLAEWLRTRGEAPVHVLGWSLGGAVALELAGHAPELVESLILVGSLGVVEHELLGEQNLNHALHELALAAGHAARWFLPHFGAADGLQPAISFGRSFAETDQRRMRSLLEGLATPVRIVHGAEDPLVPVAAAEESARLVPQARLTLLEEASHFLPQRRTSRLAAEVVDWTQAVERGTAPRRAQASSERIAAASAPFTPTGATGSGALLAGGLLALATFASEDLACITGGVLVGQGRLPWLLVSMACFFGILIGDLGLFLAGRWLGRRALGVAPFRWVLSEARVEDASQWFRTRGARVVFASRFMPGLRLPTYFAAGALHTSLTSFTLWFCLAGLVWTPLLVGAAALATRGFGLEPEDLHGANLLWVGAGLVAALVLLRIAVRSLTREGRRLLRGRWLRLTRYEFWPPWLFYGPAFAWFCLLWLRHRGLVVTAANPGIPHGGFINESKAEIMRGLGVGPELPAWTLLEPGTDALSEARRFLAGLPSPWPIVLKPDRGQRGQGVRILHDDAALDSAIGALRVPSILMEYAPGPEFGVFYVRDPGAERGRVVAVTEKVLPCLEADGERTVGELVLDDARAVALHQSYREELGARWREVPPLGEQVRLVEVGTHARGALFLDGARLITPALEASIERIVDRFAGFHFGRFDVKAVSAEALARGEGLRVIELNGVTSEETQVWDPGYGLLRAWRTQLRQWSRAWAIGAHQAKLGSKVTPLKELLEELRRYRRWAALGRIRP